MTAYVLGWGENDQDPSGQHTLWVTSAAEVDPALGRISAGGGVYQVDVYEEVPRDDDAIPPYGFQIVWGHPERAAMTWLGDDAGDAVDPSLPPWTEPIDYDFGEALPDRTRLTPTQVRAAVREYVHTGQRPTTINWIE